MPSRTKQTSSQVKGRLLIRLWMHHAHNYYRGTGDVSTRFFFACLRVSLWQTRRPGVVVVAGGGSGSGRQQGRPIAGPLSWLRQVNFSGQGRISTRVYLQHLCAYTTSSTTTLPPVPLYSSYCDAKGELEHHLSTSPAVTSTRTLTLTKRHLSTDAPPSFLPRP